MGICAESEGGTGGPDSPLKNRKNIGFLSNSGPDPLKNQSQSYQASIQCWAIISTPAKRHLNGVSLVGGGGGGGGGGMMAHL